MHGPTFARTQWWSSTHRGSGTRTLENRLAGNRASRCRTRRSRVLSRRSRSLRRRLVHRTWPSLRNNHAPHGRCWCGRNRRRRRPWRRSGWRSWRRCNSRRNWRCLLLRGHWGCGGHRCAGTGRHSSFGPWRRRRWRCRRRLHGCRRTRLRNDQSGLRRRRNRRRCFWRCGWCSGSRCDRGHRLLFRSWRRSHWAWWRSNGSSLLFANQPEDIAGLGDMR